MARNEVHWAWLNPCAKYGYFGIEKNVLVNGARPYRTDILSPAIQVNQHDRYQVCGVLALKYMSRYIWKLTNIIESLNTEMFFSNRNRWWNPLFIQYNTTSGRILICSNK